MIRLLQLLLLLFAIGAIGGCVSIAEAVPSIFAPSESSSGTDADHSSSRTATAAPGARSAAVSEQGSPLAAEEADWDISALDTARDVAYLSQVEKNLVLELNKVRTDPEAYAEQYLEPRRRYYDGLLFRAPGKVAIQTNEGRAALDECIAALQSTSPLLVLSPSRGLSLAALDHVENTGPAGAVGHTGRDGSSPADRVSRHGSWSGSIGETISYGTSSAPEIVIQLLVDDGVPSRGHRRIILDGSFKRVGVSVGRHSRYEVMAVANFASEYEESN